MCRELINFWKAVFRCFASKPLKRNVWRNDVHIILIYERLLTALLWRKSHRRRRHRANQVVMNMNQPIFTRSLLQLLLFAVFKIHSTRSVTMMMLLTTVIWTRTIHRIPNRYMLVKDSTSIIRLTSNRHAFDLEAVKHKFRLGQEEHEKTWDRLHTVFLVKCRSLKGKLMKQQ